MLGIALAALAALAAPETPVAAVVVSETMVASGALPPLVLPKRKCRTSDARAPPLSLLLSLLLLLLSPLRCVVVEVVGDGASSWASSEHSSESVLAHGMKRM